MGKQSNFTTMTPLIFNSENYVMGTGRIKLI